jgi:hypothetical protein
MTEWDLERIAALRQRAAELRAITESDAADSKAAHQYQRAVADVLPVSVYGSPESPEPPDEGERLQNWIEAQDGVDSPYEPEIDL